MLSLKKEKAKDTYVDKSEFAQKQFEKQSIEKIMLQEYKQKAIFDHLQ